MSANLMGQRRGALELSLEIGSAQFVCAAVLSSVVLWNGGSRAFGSYVIAASVPAMASLGFAVLALCVPSVVAVGRLAFPLYITAPLMHCMGMLLASTLTRASFGFRVPHPQLVPTFIWTEPHVIAVAFGSQVVLLAALSAMKHAGAPQAER